MDFQKSTVYQIYPKSFYDTNGDGLGDLCGVIAKLDYIQQLGVDYIWLTPFFVSPQKDNGYDVEDYYNIDPRYGTMDDLEMLIREADKRGIRLMLDMVFNHTSSRNQWFQKALAGDPVYKDFYIFKDGKPNGAPPTNWESKFGGSAWEYVPALGQYYLHLFDVSQPDLNWDNPAVRQEIQNVVNFWIEKGIKGFRFDVINLISKGDFADDPAGDGRSFYTDGPNIHRYLQELNEKTFGRYPDIVTVGEMSSTSIENCYRYAGADQKELSMVFSFHHLKTDFMGNEKWVLVPNDFKKLKQILFQWQTGMASHNAWNALFWCNHDQPRPVSRYGDEGEYWKQSAKMLATVIHCMRGTPYIYQGEEIGMTNAGFTELAQYRDVESINQFAILRRKGLTESDAYRILQIHSRDNGRTPMQWSAGPNGGFTTGTPWIQSNANAERINAEAQQMDEESILNYYRKLVQLRKKDDCIAYGDIMPLAVEHTSIIAYLRSYMDERILVICNFYREPTEVDMDMNLIGAQKLLGNYDAVQIQDKTVRLRPYEAMVLKLQ